jgi:hypothetical protein
MEIKNKRECYDLYDKGLFGNRALSWDSYEELLKSDWRGDVCIRGKGNGIPRIDVKYNIPHSLVGREVERLVKKGYPEGVLRFIQSMPDQSLSIQGEVIDYNTGGFEITYSLVQKPMNLALAEDTRFAKGLAARIILRSRMDSSSFEDLQALLEIFPESAIEFSTYDVCVGDIPGRNTVFWEVRNY